MDNIERQKEVLEFIKNNMVIAYPTIELDLYPVDKLNLEKHIKERDYFCQDCKARDIIIHKLIKSNEGLKKYIKFILKEYGGEK